MFKAKNLCLLVSFSGLTWLHQSTNAQAATQEQLIATIEALQKRVAALEAQANRGTGGRAPSAQRRARSVAGAPTTITLPTAFRSDQPTIGTSNAVSGFGGFYGSIFGGYQTALNRKPERSPFIAPTAPEYSAFGSAKFGGSIGYDRVLGDVLVGVEGRIYSAFGSARGGGVFGSPINNPPTFPRLSFSSCCGINPALIPAPSDFVLSSTIATQTKIDRGAGGEASLRVGFITGDTLLYGRVGAGAQEVSASYRYDATGFVTCVAPTYQDQATQFGQVTRYITGCGSFRNDGAFVRSRTSIAPFVLAGAGIEHNFGSFFVRVEGGLNVMLTPNIAGIKSQEVFITPEAIGAVGYRF